RLHSRRKLHQEVDLLLDLAKPRIVRRAVAEGSNLGRLLTAEIAGGVDAVDPDVDQRAAAGQRLLEPPLLRVALCLPIAGAERLQLAELAPAREPDRFPVVGFVLQAVCDHELLR